MTSIVNDIQRAYRQGSMLMRLIFINIGVFLLLHVVAIGALLFNGGSDGLLQWVEMPSDLWSLARRPWTVLTYMFTHYALLHILFNMLWLYWLGRIFMEFFSSKQLVGVYLLGGFGGAILYLLAYNLLPVLAGGHALLLGASASVIAVVVATAVYVPDYKIGLLFLGEVSLKWVAVVTIIFDLLGLEGGNMGGSIAHLGGAAVGVWFAMRIKRGHDITRALSALLDAVAGLFSGRTWRWPVQLTRGKGASPSAVRRPSTQGREAAPVSEEELDRILGKIKVAGYDALSKEEKDKLFKVSRRREP